MKSLLFSICLSQNISYAIDNPNLKGVFISIDGLNPKYVDWVVFNAPGYMFKNNKKSQDILLPSSARGAHGHPLSLNTMATGFYFKSKKILKSRKLDEFSLIDAVPTFTKSLGISPPKDCLGKSRI